MLKQQALQHLAEAEADARSAEHQAQQLAAKATKARKQLQEIESGKDTTDTQSMTPQHIAPQPSWKHAKKAKQAKQAEDEAKAAAQTFTADAVCRRGNSLTGSPVQLMDKLDHMLERPNTAASPKSQKSVPKAQKSVLSPTEDYGIKIDDALEGQLDGMLRKMNAPRYDQCMSLHL